MIETFKETRENTARWAIIDSKAKELRLYELFQFLNRNSIVAVVIKGWAVARFYPPDHPRAYTDIDIAVALDEHERVWRLLRESEGMFHVDLHKGLRDLDKTDWNEIVARSYVLQMQSTDIRVLSDEDNLRVTAVHWLIDGGINRERLYDVYYLVQNRRPDFDWRLCLGSDGDVRKTWVTSAIVAAVEYLGLDAKSLPDDVRNASLPGWFRSTLEREWKLGVYPRVPLRLCLHSRKLFLEQVRRRVPPNKIAATVEMEEPIDARGRTSIQMRSAGKRAASFLHQLRNPGA